MKMTQEDIEKIIGDYIDKNYGEYNYAGDYIPQGDDVSINKIIPTDTGYYVEGIMLFDMHPEMCDSEFQEGDFWATVDKNFKVLELDWELY